MRPLQLASNTAGATDVMLAELAPGTVIAGTFTRSKTRSAPVLDCQDKLGDSLGSGGGDCCEFRQRERLYRYQRCDFGQGHYERRGRVAGRSPNGGSSPRPPASLANLCPMTGSRQRWRSLNANLSEDGIAEAGAGHHDHRHLPQRRDAADRDRRENSHYRRDRQGLGHDRSRTWQRCWSISSPTQKLLAKICNNWSLSGCDKTFNCITVDSDTSTSDTLLVAATGASGVDVSGDSDAFAGALHRSDGRSGHTRLSATVKVRRSSSRSTSPVRQAAEDAKLVAFSIANSPLVKTAIAGEDPNWGRVVMAVGKSGAEADRDRLSIWFGDVLVAKDGQVAAGL